jgi:RNA polymerase sigma-70 factor (ECF subfamily)
LSAVSKRSGSYETPAGGDLGDEAELIRRCQVGERAAQEELYRRHRRAVAGNLFRVMGDRTDLDDLIQEVFVIAFRGLDRFRGEARLSTWLYRICINVALGRIRQRARRPTPLPLERIGGDRASEADGPEAQLLEHERRQRVYRALDAMAPKKRMVLYLHEIEGHDLKQIAYLVGANPATVRTRLFYARREFYELLARDGEEGER